MVSRKYVTHLSPDLLSKQDGTRPQTGSKGRSPLRSFAELVQRLNWIPFRCLAEIYLSWGLVFQLKN